MISAEATTVMRELIEKHGYSGTFNHQSEVFSRCACGIISLQWESHLVDVLEKNGFGPMEESWEESAESTISYVEHQHMGGDPEPCPYPSVDPDGVNQSQYKGYGLTLGQVLLLN